MKTLYLSIAAVFVQAIGLVLFSMLSGSAVGKAIVLTLTAFCLAALLFYGVKVLPKKTLLFLPALFSLSYVAAFLFVGVFKFHGFLNGFDLSLSYALSLAKVLGTTFVLYAFATAGIYEVVKLFQNKAE